MQLASSGMLTIIWWWYGDVTVYIISTGQEYTANKINRKASSPQGSITSRYLGKLAQTHTTPPLFPFSESNSTWPKRAGVGGGGGKKNRYPKGTCVRYLICVKGYEPMTIVWDTTGTPFKNKSNYAQVTNTTFFCTVLLVDNTTKPRVTSRTYFISECAEFPWTGCC